MRSIYSYILATSAILLIGIAGAYLTSSVGIAQDAPPLPAEAAAAAQLEGTVLEKVDVAGYTYVQVDTAGETVWAAAPSVAVKVGDTVSFSTNMPMENFYSRSLQREFEIIYFVDRFISDSGTSSIDSEAAAAHGQMAPSRLSSPCRIFARPREATRSPRLCQTVIWCCTPTDGATRSWTRSFTRPMLPQPGPFCWRVWVVNEPGWSCAGEPDGICCVRPSPC